MVPAAALAALAAHLSFLLAEGALPAGLHEPEVSYIPPVEHGVVSEKLGQHIQLTTHKATSSQIRPVLGAALLFALSMGLFLLLRSTHSLTFLLKGAGSSRELDESEWDLLEEVQPGGGENGEDGKDGTASGRRGLSTDAKDSLAEGPSGAPTSDLPADDPVTLGPEKVKSRILKMKQVLQWIQEGDDDSGRSVDSTGEAFAHRLRLANTYRYKNKNAEFEPSVPADQILEFKTLIEIIERTLNHYYGREG